jgi:hypothetical protein
MLDRSRCIIIVPVYQNIEPRCENGLRGLERAGYRVWRRNGGAAIDLGRNRLCAQALEEGYSELMWIDSDIGFPVDAVDHLRELDKPLVGCAYAKKGEASFAFHREDGADLEMGPDGGIIEVTYLPAGFMYTRREVYETIATQLQLPLCNRLFGEVAFVPYFLPMVVPHGSEHWYLSEDYAFCHRARQCGIPSLLDTRVRLAHVGSYGYTWEDACGERTRYERFQIHLNAPPKVREGGGGS